MEYSDKENTEKTPFTIEENHNLSTTEGVENQQYLTENIQSSTDSNIILPEINATDEQNIGEVVSNFSESNLEGATETVSESLTEASLENVNDKDINSINSSSEDLELIKSDSGTAELESVSEGIVTEAQTEKYQEYVSISQEEGSQTAEYVSDYVLEDQSENVYTPEDQNVNIDLSEGHSRVATDSNLENNILNTEAQNDGIPENSTDQVNNEEWPQIEQTNDNQLENNIKLEYLNSNAEDNSGTEEANTSLGATESLITEQLVEENITNPSREDKAIENSNQASEEREENNSYEIKKENHAVAIEGFHSVIVKEQVLDNVNESPIHEQEVICNDEVMENADVTNMSGMTSENISVEGYAVSEGMEVTEMQEGEYTIVEGPSSLEISTNQVDDSGNSGETWVLLENQENSEYQEEFPLEAEIEQNEAYLSELRNEAVSRQSTENKPRRGRKPTYDIPMHVLGHDISKPVESVANGRTLPKPRLGVKVPYRNLTSQIVSKAEIEREVMERARLKQEQANSRGDIIFARKLTQRLARKIAPSPDPPKRNSESKKSRELNANQKKPTQTIIQESKETENNQHEDNSKIHNDSDLLAILEGEGDEMPVLPKEVPQPQVDDSNLKMLEREIALQQLQDLPNQAPKHRIYKGRQIRPDVQVPVLIQQTSKGKSDTGTKDSASSQKSISKPTDDQAVHVLSDKENETAKKSASKETSSISPKRDQSNVETSVSSPKKQPVEIEPQVKVNMVLKTYSRKRKTIDLPETFMESPQPKKSVYVENESKAEKTDTTPTNVYVTKSSRIIKKKVIWDPDETPTRSPKTVAKSDALPPKVVSPKPVKIIEKVPSSEKISEKKPVTEKLIKEKVIEKKTNEKSPLKKPAAPSIERKAVVAKSDVLKNKVPIKNKKSRSEVDKLLMDEGAVKMLYDLKNNDDVPRKKKDVYSVEKAHKDIMKKANEIKSDLQQNTSNESPKSLRKKDSFTPSPIKPASITYNAERKMSKDSTRSSVHTPPGSPAYSFPHSQSSMLVRRRSSSSISSSDEVDENDTSKVSRKRSLTTLDVPKSKKLKKSEANEDVELPDTVKDAPEKPSTENKMFTYKSFTVKKTSKHATIGLNYLNESCRCTVQVLDELTAVLKKFAKEKDCHVVSITSSSKAFCLGLDYKSLISDNEVERKEKAAELAEKVREFLLCLLKFPKVLIAGIQGDCVGLGVTMLPLFDMVIASDTATFSTPYVNLGCAAEAGFLLSAPIFNNHGLAADLLYNTQKITADDACRRGLVTRLCWPEKYNETLKNTVNSVSRGSKQSLVATKKQLRRHLLQTTEAAINSESKVLVEHWTSLECQEKFAQINENSVA